MWDGFSVGDPIVSTHTHQEIRFITHVLLFSAHDFSQRIVQLIQRLGRCRLMLQEEILY